jgi:hypothetical protein
MVMDENEKTRYKVARPGDVLMCPFECDSCQLWKLTGGHSEPQTHREDRLSVFIRRAQLDAFWAREPGTVSGNLNDVKKILRAQEDLGFVTLPDLGPWPASHDHGMGLAVSMLHNSLNPGRHEATVKFATVRKVQSAMANVWAASAVGAAGSSVWLMNNKTRGATTQAVQGTEWFARFKLGLNNRMGDRVKQDAAVSIGVMLRLMEKFESIFQKSEPRSAQRKECVECACFCLISYCVSMRGFEVPKVILHFLRDFRQPERAGDVDAHVGLPLAGRFKLRGNMDQNLLLFMAKRTQSGLEPMLWIDRLIDELELWNITTGWAFQREDESPMRLSDFQDVILDLLLEIQKESPELIDPDIDVRDAYGLARSFRRGSVTRAENCQVDAKLIEYMNRWITNKRKDQPYFQGDMRIHYGDQRQMAKKFLPYSQAL